MHFNFCALPYTFLLKYKNTAGIRKSRCSFIEKKKIDNFKKKLEAEATSAIYQLSDYLYRYYKKKVIQE